MPESPTQAGPTGPWLRCAGIGLPLQRDLRADALDSARPALRLPPVRSAGGSLGGFHPGGRAAPDRPAGRPWGAQPLQRRHAVRPGRRRADGTRRHGHCRDDGPNRALACQDPPARPGLANRAARRALAGASIGVIMGTRRRDHPALRRAALPPAASAARLGDGRPRVRTAAGAPGLRGRWNPRRAVRDFPLAGASGGAGARARRPLTGGVRPAGAGFCGPCGHRPPARNVLAS